MFQKIILNNEYSFNDLIDNIIFEDICNGRKGAVMVDYKNNMIPIIRTTTKYNNPVQEFNSNHYKLINDIQKLINNYSINFNNALIEIYNSKYRKMNFHTDQSLDINDDSYICIYSCYNNKIANRKLITKNKTTNEIKEYLLDNNSIILFSTNINKQYLHKIISSNNNTNEWLGITFRLSKTFIEFIDEIPYILNNNKKLYMASNDEQKQFMINKSNENKEINYIYPETNYTISPSDLLNIYIK